MFYVLSSTSTSGTKTWDHGLFSTPSYYDSNLEAYCHSVSCHLQIQLKFRIHCWIKDNLTILWESRDKRIWSAAHACSIICASFPIRPIRILVQVNYGYKFSKYKGIWYSLPSNFNINSVQKNYDGMPYTLHVLTSSYLMFHFDIWHFWDTIS